jgi:hypothetical protein
MARDANTLAHADRRSSQDHIHRSKRLGSRRSVAMTFGMRRSLPTRDPMIGITVTSEAYVAIKATLPADTHRRGPRLGELADLRETCDLAHVDLRERVHDCAFLTSVDTDGMPGGRAAC